MYSLTCRVRVVTIATQPCTDCKSAQCCTTRGQPIPLPRVTSGCVQ